MVSEPKPLTNKLEILWRNIREAGNRISSMHLTWFQVTKHIFNPHLLYHISKNPINRIAALPEEYLLQNQKISVCLTGNSKLLNSFFFLLPFNAEFICAPCSFLSRVLPLKKSILSHQVNSYICNDIYASSTYKHE